VPRRPPCSASAVASARSAPPPLRLSPVSRAPYPVSAPTNAPGRWVTGLSHGQIPPLDSCLIHCLVGYFVSWYRIYKYAIAKICQNHESNWIDHTNICQRRVDKRYTRKIFVRKKWVSWVSNKSQAAKAHTALMQSLLEQSCARSDTPFSCTASAALEDSSGSGFSWAGYEWPWWFMFMVETQTSTAGTIKPGWWFNPSEKY